MSLAKLFSNTTFKYILYNLIPKNWLIQPIKTINFKYEFKDIIIINYNEKFD